MNGAMSQSRHPSASRVIQKPPECPWVWPLEAPTRLVPLEVRKAALPQGSQARASVATVWASFVRPTPFPFPPFLSGGSDCSHRDANQLLFPRPERQPQFCH